MILLALGLAEGERPGQKFFIFGVDFFVALCYTLIMKGDENMKKNTFIIHNKPKEADDYEFVVAVKDDLGEYYYVGHFADGHRASRLALRFGVGRAVVFHNVRIQGCRK